MAPLVEKCSKIRRGQGLFSFLFQNHAPIFLSHYTQRSATAVSFYRWLHRFLRWFDLDDTFAFYDVGLEGNERIHDRNNREIHRRFSFRGHSHLPTESCPEL